ncbi:hypothetical protein DV738_g4271, partial [Chaetothyriales sp. CBS 135597]
MVQRTSTYSSTRFQGGSLQESFSFEDVVLKGLASDGGLFHPNAIPQVQDSYLDWKDLRFDEVAFNIMRVFIDPSEISDTDLRSICGRSYSTFRETSVTPLVTLSQTANLHLLELFHGPTFAFKDVALQFLGNLFEYFLTRKNKDVASDGSPRHHLTVVGATSGDTGSAAIYGLRNKKDVSIFIMFPTGKVSPVQELQMTTVLDPNVHCLSVAGTFDNCQDYVKQLFADPEANRLHRLGAVNSINWARILAQITYYFTSYFQLLKAKPDLNKVKYVVPTGNFGDILAGYYAKQMGLPVSRLVIATNENDILHRFWQTGTYSKQSNTEQEETKEDSVRETHSPAMDILVSSNFERLLWHLSLEHETDVNPGETAETHIKNAGAKIAGWFQQLKTTGSFTVEPEILAKARALFTTYRVSDEETIEQIRSAYRGESIENKGYVLDPHSAIGVAAALREIKASSSSSSSPADPVISLATAHPAKFADAVELALKNEPDFTFQSVLPPQFVGLETQDKKVIVVPATAGLAQIRDLITTEVDKEKQEREQQGKNGRA